MTDEIKVSFTKDECIAFIRGLITRWEGRRLNENREMGLLERLNEFEEWLNGTWDELTDDGDLRE